MRQRYKDEVTPKLRERFGIKNPMAVPKLEKILLTVGLGKQLEGTKLIAKARQQVIKDLAVITGQQPIMCRAKKSVSNFKVRKGYEVGAMVTLRGERMWEFLDRLVSMAIPRIKDFRGLSKKSFDGRGNYSFGVGEQGIFPEVDMGKIDFAHGMNVTIVFRNSDNDRTLAALTELGMPFTREGDAALN